MLHIHSGCALVASTKCVQSFTPLSIAIWGPMATKARARARPPLGKAKPKGNAKAQGKAKAQGQAQPRGWQAMRQHPARPMGQLCAQAAQDHLQALVAADPKKHNHLLWHYDWLREYSYKLDFALQLKLYRSGSFMTASETHASASVDNSGFEDGWMETQWWPTSLVC